MSATTVSRTTTQAPPRWLRIVVPGLIIAAWLAAGAVGGPYFGRVDEVSSNDPTAYLPDSAEATTVQRRLGEFVGTGSVPAVVVFTSDAPLTDDQLAAIDARLTAASELEGVDGGTSPALPSEDGLAAQAFVPLVADDELAAHVAALSAELRSGLPDGVRAHVTGPAGFSAALVSAFSGIDGLLLVVALVAVAVILVLVYRSALLPVAVLGTSLFALCAALLVVWWLAKAGVLLLSGQTQGILFILVIGAATDYSLLLVARYKEELKHAQDPLTAIVRALKGSIEPILASGGTVIAGLLCLLLSDLRSNSALGPVTAIGIALAMLAALTFLPAVLYALGRAVFWPRRPRFESETVDLEAVDAAPTGWWGRLAAAVAKRPRLVWVATTAVLALATLGVTQLRADGVPQSELILGGSEAQTGQRLLAEHFPGGAGSPVYVLVPADEMQAAADAMLATPGIASVAVTAPGSFTGTARVTADGIAAGRPGAPAPEPTVVNGDVLLQGTLVDPADSDAAVATVRGLRSDLAARLQGDAAVGGATATAIDTVQASVHDRNLIIPIVLVVITLILMVLLRAVLAPVLLILTTVLSFGATMGIAALVFNGLLGFPGADPAVPLYGFVFLVALGIDYNIFLMTRVREEALRVGTRRGVIRGLVVTGGVITSAGVVLAATFAALGVIPVLFLAQLAFIVAFGVLLDTFVVRSLLVPALALDVGKRIWWPSRLARAAD
ncbi:MAG TPA: efflux RND transporter permease subunit [Trueperaceae bacterium]|nr:efflux RND transporter permease subunit [Trueperaceae bacterium]